MSETGPFRTVYVPLDL